jgi:ATP-binding cassette subfamily C protein EexD
MSSNRNPEARPLESPLRQALQSCRQSFLYAGLFSLCINLLLLVPTFYMLAVYDRVLSSGSEMTLWMVSGITLFLFAVLGGLEWVRSRILVAASVLLDSLLGGRVFGASFAQAVGSGGRIASAQPLSDLMAVRQYLSGQGPLAFFDAPWLPVYLALLFLFHPWFGFVGVLSGVVLIGLAIWNERATHDILAKANQESIEANHFTQRNLRNAEVVEAMGMLPRLRARWQKKQSQMLGSQAQASATAGLIGAISRTFRLTIQSMALGLGAYLALHKEISPGMVIAGSILLGRALAPLDSMIGSWRGFAQARDAYGHLDELLRSMPLREAPMALPAPRGQISCEHLTVTPPGAGAPVLRDIHLVIDPGTQVAVIGPSASGKSTLARSLLGLVRLSSGNVRLDGADPQQWDREQLGTFIGYLPQDVELLEGSVAENIARFGEVDAERVVAAASAAGIHEMILKLPAGYESQIVGSHMFSAGQRQRMGIARAVYGEPPIIVLDEPNSNLDQEGEAALAATLAFLKEKGKTVVLVTHRPSALAHVDKVLLLMAGQVAAYGPRDEVIALLNQGAGGKSNA